MLCISIYVDMQSLKICTYFLNTFSATLQCKNVSNNTLQLSFILYIKIEKMLLLFNEKKISCNNFNSYFFSFVKDILAFLRLVFCLMYQKIHYLLQNAPNSGKKCNFNYPPKTKAKINTPSRILFNRVIYFKFVIKK